MSVVGRNLGSFPCTSHEEYWMVGRGDGVSVMCAILGCTAQVCLLIAVLCGSPAVVCPTNSWRPT